MRLLVVATMLMLTAGCGASLSSRMASWQGGQIDAVVLAWGPADECLDIADRRFCVWRDTTAFEQVTCTRTLEIDAQGTVIGWRWRGDRCEVVATDAVAKTGTGDHKRLTADARPPS